MTDRACTRCGETKPRTAEHFGRYSRGSDGLTARCRPCDRAAKREIGERARRAQGIKPRRVGRNPERSHGVKTPAAVARRVALARMRRLTRPGVMLMHRTNARVSKFRAKYGHKIGSRELLGCGIDDFATYIAGRLLPGMSWANRHLWHLDHIRPLVTFDLADEAQYRAAFHFSNVQPLWAEDNMAKGARMAA